MPCLAHRSPSPDGDVRKGASKEQVVKLYNGQFTCEHAFRIMKSSLGLGCIYLQTPQRVDAMLFIVFLERLDIFLIDSVTFLMPRAC